MSDSISSEGTTLLNSVIPILLKIGTVVVGLVSIAAGLLYSNQDSLLYFPAIGGIPRRPSQNPRRYRSPQEHGIPFETHLIKCEDGLAIHSWLLLQPDARRKNLPTIVFFHGNAGNIGLRLPNAMFMYNHLKVNVFMVEYRGYGDSDDAKPNEAGLKLDAEAALRFIAGHGQVDPERIFCFGRSLGGAVAFHLAQYAEQHSLPLAGLLVENTFLSVSHMVDQVMPFLTPIKPLVLKIRWNNYEIAPKIRTPILYLAGEMDELVPHSQMLELYHMSKESSTCARIHVIKGGTHNESWAMGGKLYWQKIQDFLLEVTALGGAESSTPTALRNVKTMDVDNIRSVGMGNDLLPTSPDMSAIPTVPSNFIGIAREATNVAMSQTNDKKKDK